MIFRCTVYWYWNYYLNKLIDLISESMNLSNKESITPWNDFIALKVRLRYYLIYTVPCLLVYLHSAQLPEKVDYNPTKRIIQVLFILTKSNFFIFVMSHWTKIQTSVRAPPHDTSLSSRVIRAPIFLHTGPKL